jgi:hypothetical protein
MPLFRKLPVVIEAEQFWPTERPWPIGVYENKNIDAYFIRSLEGIMEVTPGDWIITGVHGEKYPCKPDIFLKTYEPVE